MGNSSNTKCKGDVATIINPNHKLYGKECIIHKETQDGYKIRIYYLCEGKSLESRIGLTRSNPYYNYYTEYVNKNDIERTGERRHMPSLSLHQRFNL